MLRVVGEEPEDADLDAPKIYEPISTYESLSDRLNMFMQQYNETVRGGKMDLVFFKVSRLFQFHRAMNIPVLDTL